MRCVTWLLALLLFPSSFALAAPAAIVEAVQAPAWLERGGQRQPLAAGMAVSGGDVLRTGPGARAYVLLAEGSRVKLGESTRLALHSRSLNPRRAFRGALDVLDGAFRYTTALAGKIAARPQHELAIRVGTATIGIRGTDIWGRTNADGELVALIEGRIDITRAGQVIELTEPLTYYDAPRGQAAGVKSLAPELLRQLARQTEIQAGDGAARTTGAWRLRAGVADSNAAALELYDQVRAAGFAARIRPSRPEGDAPGWRYEIFSPGFASADEAWVAAGRLKALTGLDARAVR